MRWAGSVGRSLGLSRNRLISRQSLYVYAATEGASTFEIVPRLGVEPSPPEVTFSAVVKRCGQAPRSFVRVMSLLGGVSSYGVASGALPRELPRRTRYFTRLTSTPPKRRSSSHNGQPLQVAMCCSISRRAASLRSRRALGLRPALLMRTPAGPCCSARR